MRKILFCAVVFCMALTISTAAWAEQGPYIRANVGAAFLTDSDITSPAGTSTIEFDSGLALDAALGYRFGMWRFEGEVGYQKNGIDRVSDATGSTVASGDYSSYSAMANVYADFYNRTCVTPFITAGIGAAKIKVDDLSVGGTSIGTASDAVFAYQVGAGLGYAVNENLTFDLRYRYFGTEDPGFDNNWKTEFGAHTISLGLRCNF